MKIVDYSLIILTNKHKLLSDVLISGSGLNNVDLLSMEF